MFIFVYLYVSIYQIYLFYPEYNNTFNNISNNIRTYKCSGLYVLKNLSTTNYSNYSGCIDVVSNGIIEAFYKH